MIASSQILSPLTHSENVIATAKIDCQSIVKIYQQGFNVDVTRYLKHLEFIDIYTCLDTGYQFYYPFGLEGDQEFYQALQDFPWYYLEGKWEFDLALSLIQSSDRVLEIGCGRGAFIQKLARQGITCTGLEFNPAAIQFGIKQGFTVLDHTIEAHAQAHPATYDVVCTFQVLEHVADVRSFIQSAIQALKVGGKLIIAVPNNRSFIQHDQRFVLNMPPHHAGLWSETAFSRLPIFFPLKLEQLYFETLQSENCRWYYEVQAQRLRSQISSIPGLNKLTNRLTFAFTEPGIWWIEQFRHKIRSHSMLAVYTRTA